MKEKELERVFKALANKRRLAILIFLKKKKKANVGEIAEAIKLSFRSTSKHLSMLISAGILEKEQLGLFSFYFIPNDLDPTLKQITSSI